MSKPENNPPGLAVPFSAAQTTHVAWFAQDNTGSLVTHPVVAYLPVVHDYRPGGPHYVEWVAAILDPYGALVEVNHPEIAASFNAEFIGVTRAGVSHPRLDGIPDVRTNEKIHIAKNGTES